MQSSYTVATLRTMHPFGRYQVLAAAGGLLLVLRRIDMRRKLKTVAIKLQECIKHQHFAE